MKDKLFLSNHRWSLLVKAEITDWYQFGIIKAPASKLQLLITLNRFLTLVCMSCGQGTSLTSVTTYFKSLEYSWRTAFHLTASHPGFDSQHCHFFQKYSMLLRFIDSSIA